MRQPAARRDAIGHVREAVGPQRGEIGEDRLHEQVRVQGRDAVDLVAADDGQISHAHTALAALVDEREPRQEAAIARTELRCGFEELGIDAEDDFQVTRQHVLHQRYRPGFQRLRHEGVVGVREGLPADFPGRCPGHRVLVAQQSHQLGHADRRVRVVQVDRDLLGQVGQRAVLQNVALNNVLHRSGDKKVFLTQAQLAPGGGAVVRIEHPGNVLELVLDLRGAAIVARVEGMQIEVSGRHGFPQAQRADLLGGVARYYHVISLGDDLASVTPHRPVAEMLDPAAEAHGETDVGTREFPWGAVGQPRVWIFDLRATHDVLRKHAIFITDAVAERRQAEGRHRVQEARREASEAAVAQRGIGFARRDFFERMGMFDDALRGGFGDTECSQCI